MRLILRSDRAFILILTSALLWTSFAWAVPWSRLGEETEPTPAEELPLIEYESLTCARSAHGGILPELLDVAAAGETWTCGNCGAENPADAKFCSQCGEEKPGEGPAAPGLQNMRVCPKCGFVNEKDARFCGDCGYSFYGAGGTASAVEMVYVPGRGNVPKGTMIDPGHHRLGVWLTGLLMWLLVGPGIAAAGIGEDSLGLYIAGGTVATAGLVMFIVGLVTKTEPVYAGLNSEADGRLTRRAEVARALDAESAEFRIEVPVVSF
jgi:ribosomal protein L40E